MTRGFTLIEMSIVLVIIGLIVGGVLVGSDLIAAATVRSQISQIEKYQTATNTFRVKYGYLPGDMPDPAASNYGFTQRGQFAGEGDGNGVIEGVGANSAGFNTGFYESTGETIVFWRDLSDAHLIDARFSTASSYIMNSGITATSTPNLLSSFPTAKLGRGNMVFAWSSGLGCFFNIPPFAYSDNNNYFGISIPVPSLGANYSVYSDPGMTVQEAYNIDKKIDDGLPQSGRVLAYYLDWQRPPEAVAWASANAGMLGDYDGDTGGAITSKTVSPVWDSGGIANKCYDNSQNINVTEKYNMAYPGNINCALSFRFQ